MDEKIRIGVLGLRRGTSFINSAKALDQWAEIGAICDMDQVAVDRARNHAPGASTYSSYEDMLGGDVDAIVLCNYCPDHAPAAVKALEAGKHVLSEVIACHTIAEGVELARTVEKSGMVYMYGENYPYMAATQEMRRLYEAGILGQFRYGEGEYVHFSRDILHRLINGPEHWRMWFPPTYYCTHSLGPLLRVTGLRPVEVAGAAVPGTGQGWTGDWRSDYGIEMVRLENGALVKSLHGGGCPREPWSPWYVVYGTGGVIENRRWPDYGEVTLYTDGMEKPKTYQAEFRELGELAFKSGHGGGDLFVMYEFLKAIKTGEKPDIDIY
ncbi:MAG: Gfo/Idh/MocA family oxidoreductase, partial [Theionarchaea archaeon]|nr:Gfo/Idh/MocA family oxidoreductase [Theionarchaea archaeon]